MSAKARFLQKLQERRPRNGAFENKSQADIAEFCQKMQQLQESIEAWLTDTGVRTESVSVSLIEFLIGGRAFSVPGIHLRFENRLVKFTPLFLYGQGVTGCVEVSLCADGCVTPLYRLFMRAGENSSWTWRPAGIASGKGKMFGEDAFFEMIEGLLS